MMGLGCSLGIALGRRGGWVSPGDGLRGQTGWLRSARGVSPGGQPGGVRLSEDK